MSIWQVLRSKWVCITVAMIVATVALTSMLVLQTMPPSTLVMATGPEGGAYYEIGKRYEALLTRSGVRVQLVSTSGALENLALLRNPHSGVSVSLIQGGVTAETDTNDVESLG